MKKEIWNLINTTLIVILIVFIFFNYNSESPSKTFFIDNIKLYKEFNMTNDLSKLNEEKFKTKIIFYDSIVKGIKIFEKVLQSKIKISFEDKGRYAKKQKEIVEKERELQAIKEIVKNEINAKVWERLNDYIKDYGKSNNIDLLLGAQGQGNIMYGDEKLDITMSFIEYANNRYEGN